MFKPLSLSGAVVGSYPLQGVDTTGVADAGDALAAALASAAVSGGVVQMPAGRIRVARGDFDVGNGVTVRGLGGDAFKGSVSDPTFDPATLLVYDGPSGGTLFRSKRVNGSAFEGFGVDGQNKLGRAWRLACWQGGHLRDLSTINMGSQNSPTVHGLPLEIASDSVIRYTGSTHNGSTTVDNLLGYLGLPADASYDLAVGMTVTGTNILNGANGTGSFANGATQVTAATGSWIVGQSIAHANIPAGTTVLNVSGSAGNLTLDISSTTTGSGSTVTLTTTTTIAAILSSSSVRISSNGQADGSGIALTFQSSTGRNSHAFMVEHLNLSGAQCIYLEGDSTADPCIGTFQRVQMLFGSGSGNEDCVNVKTADNIHWIGVYAFKNFGTGFGFHSQDGGRNHHIVHIYPATTGYKGEQPTSAVWGNRIDGYQRGDAAVAPTLAAGANLVWQEDGTSTGQRSWNLIKTASRRNTLTYSTPVVIDGNLGNLFDLTVTNATPFTVGNPTNLTDGQMIYLTIRNTTGGALGAATFNTTWKIAGGAWVQPGAGQSRTLVARYDGTNLVELSRTAADVPN